MALSDYERFQQQMFDHLDDLEEADKQRRINDFIRAGFECGIDVVAEIQGKRRSVSEIVAEVQQRQQRT
jgi:hypothetical protein